MSSNVDKKNILLIECISEFLGTGLIVFLNSSYIASLQLINKFNNCSWKFSFILGLSTCTSIYFSSLISKSHLNPIVTFSFFLLSNFKKSKMLPYIISQISGSFVFSFIVYILYYNSLVKFNKHNDILKNGPDNLNIASIFSFFPNKDINIEKIFIIEVIITFIFILVIFILNDKKFFCTYNSLISPILIGTLIFIFNIVISPFSSFTLNPAHDLGSQLFIYLLGLKDIAFLNELRSITNFCILIFGMIIGSIISVYFYKFIRFKN
ncbi:MAG: aquaporin [Buchnera aphidicola (Nurudea shiraii)]